MLLRRGVVGDFKETIRRAAVAALKKTRRTRSDVVLISAVVGRTVLMSEVSTWAPLSDSHFESGDPLSVAKFLQWLEVPDFLPSKR